MTTNLDNEIKQDLLCRIHARLECEHGVATDNIKISVLNGITTATGAVPCYPDKVAILKVLRTEPGIIAWIDKVKVVVPESYRCSDAQLVAAARDAIDVITTVPLSSIGITAKDNWLTLTGTVNHQTKREAVEHAVMFLSGLCGLTNLISVKAETPLPAHHG